MSAFVLKLIKPICSFLSYHPHRLGGLVAPAALVGDDVGPLAVVYVDVERAGAHDEPAVRVCGIRGVAMAAVEDDVAVLVRLVLGVAHRGKTRVRQRGQREAVLLEQRELAFPFAVMNLVRVPHAHAQQALVVPAHVVELRDRHEQRAAHRPDLVLHRPLLVPGAGVAERIGEPVVGGEGREQLRRADGAAYLPADSGRVVEDDLARHAVYVLEHGRKPLADAFGGLAVEHLRKVHVGEREGADQVVHAGSHADDPEVGLAEVDLHLARGPILVEVLGARSPVLLLAALDVLLDRRVGALEAMLRDEPLEDAPGRVALLVPILAILLEPLVDQGGA